MEDASSSGAYEGAGMGEGDGSGDGGRVGDRMDDVDVDDVAVVDTFGFSVGWDEGKEGEEAIE